MSKVKSKSTKTHTKVKAKIKPIEHKTVAAQASVISYLKNLGGHFKTGNVMLGSLFGELFGTFVLAFLILQTGGNSVIAGVEVLAMWLGPGEMLVGAH